MNQIQSQQSSRSYPPTSDDSSSQSQEVDQLSEFTTYSIDEEVDLIIFDDIEYHQYLINNVVDTTNQVLQVLPLEKSSSFQSQISSDILHKLRTQQSASAYWLEFQVRTLAQLVNELSLLLDRPTIDPQIWITPTMINDSETIHYCTTQLEIMDSVNRQTIAITDHIQFLAPRIRHYLQGYHSISD